MNMIIGRDLYEERYYSDYDDELDNIYERAFCEGYEYAQKEFGFQSKALYVASPGAWHAKETAKYMYDDEDSYKRNRGKYALRGHFTPSTARAAHYMAAELHDQGKSPKEIKKAVEKMAKKHGITQVVLGVGIYEDITDGKDYRKKFPRKRYNDED